MVRQPGQRPRERIEPEQPRHHQHRAEAGQQAARTLPEYDRREEVHHAHQR